jgi:preprotein translocase SecE subunit
VARDRQRAKQRRARREKQGGTPASAAPNQPQRENVPGELDHASGESEIFEAKLVSEAGGETAPPDAVDGVGGETAPEELTDAEFAALEDDVDNVETAFENGDEEAIEAAEEQADADALERHKDAAPGAPAPTKKGGFRFVAFLRASWAELQRVQWPDRRQVGQATAVVLGFVVVAGLYLGLADAAANWLVDRII